MTTNDHQLGNPALAAAAARDDEDAESGYEIRHYESEYPLGTPTRVIESGREALREMFEALTGETADEQKFRLGDWQPDGAILEGVSDAQILDGVHSCMLKCSEPAQLRQYSMALVERLTPLRSRELVGKIQRMTSGHFARIDSDKRRKPATPASNPFVPGGIIGGGLVPPSLSPLAVAIAQAQAEKAVAAYEAERKRPTSFSGFIQTVPVRPGRD